MAKEKKVHLEIMRLIAIFGAVYVHTGASAMYHFEIDVVGLSAWISFIMMILAQACNNIFFMITGAVLLSKEESIGAVLKYRFLRMLIVVILFSFVQYIYNYTLRPEIGMEISVFFEVIYRTSVISQYWFLYAYLALILILPFLRMLTREMKPIHYIYLFVVYVLIEGILPVVEYYWKNEPLNLSIPMLEQIIICPLLGYFIEQYGDDYLDQWKSLFVTNAVAAVAMVIGLKYSRVNYYVDGRITVLYGLLLIIAVTIFVDIRFICRRWQMPALLKRSILFLGGGVFGVYLFEPQLRDCYYFLYLKLEPYISWLPAAVIWISAAVLTGILGFRVLKRLPFLDKLL